MRRAKMFFDASGWELDINEKMIVLSAFWY